MAADLPAERRLGSVLLRVLQADQTAQKTDAIVFYAREDLDLGSGFGTAIQSRGGGSIKKELEKIGSVRTGEAVITGAGALAARYIIHACGPKFQEPDLESKLRACMCSALRLAREKNLASIAFPPMGAGFYGIPLTLCARVMIEAIRDFLNEPGSLTEVLVCVIDKREFLAFSSALESI
jgi:O-acetyl-ADP-ribose deacetylase (regulator of RNase III)